MINNIRSGALYPFPYLLLRLSTLLGVIFMVVVLSIFCLFVLEGHDVFAIFDVHTSYGQVVIKNVTDGYAIDSLFIALLANGDASIDYNLILEQSNSSTNLTLFGPTVQNLTLTDYNGAAIPFSTTENLNKVSIHNQDISNVHVTYITPDLVDKKNRNWNFSLTFNDKFLLKMPDEARIIGMEPEPFLTPTGERSLWGLGPGDVRVNYVIGPLGTRQEAQASIRLLEDSIKQTKMNYDDIVLNDTYSQLNKSKNSLALKNYLESVSYAESASALLENTTGSYVIAKSTITQVDSELQKIKQEGNAMSNSQEVLIRAKFLFSRGFYTNATSMAKLAIDQSPVENTSFVTDVSIITVISVIVVVSFTILVLRMKKVAKTNTKDNLAKNTKVMLPSETIDNTELEKNQERDLNYGSKNDSESKLPLRTYFASTFHSEEDEIKNYLSDVVKEVNNVRKNQDGDQKGKSVSPAVPMSDTENKNILERIVVQMKMNKPYLRIEDKQLLDFLVEKDGTAFESELRQKFVLPRTSLWRMVKRLEREGLLDIRKIGGQNMVKLVDKMNEE